MTGIATVSCAWHVLTVVRYDGGPSIQTCSAGEKSEKAAWMESMLQQGVCCAHDVHAGGAGSSLRNSLFLRFPMSVPAP